ncbi:hypothetical protein [Trinickia fusca]|uniref:hypothetical protein n=1 Tax=Trinickia fusca TaxID=2419777 RepID=UPI001FE854DB|nr:hypothetical protein [Trinickia fusca]
MLADIANPVTVQIHFNLNASSNRAGGNAVPVEMLLQAGRDTHALTGRVAQSCRYCSAREGYFARNIAVISALDHHTTSHRSANVPLAQARWTLARAGRVSTSSARARNRRTRQAHHHRRVET